jgi:5-oxoprolinase (ATP-hydrolysing) subunit A
VHAAAERDVAIGAQVSYRDLAGFGRRAIHVPAQSLTNDVLYQIGALDAFARAAGSRVGYVKPHGALYNQTVADEEQADAVVAAVGEYDPTLPVVGLPGSALLRLAAAAGLATVTEGFADRAYTATATLVARSADDALVTDVSSVAQRVVRMVTDGVVRSIDGSDVEVRARWSACTGTRPARWRWLGPCGRRC